MSFFDRAMAPDMWAAHFSFDQFDKRELAKKLPFWEEGALTIAELLSSGQNVGMQLGTGGGKTIIAFLAVAACGYRALFLTPQKALAHQHGDLLTLLRSRLPHRIITGETAKKRRIWNDPTDRFICATPETFLSDLKNERVDPNDFTLIIFDEFHRASGDYVYVAIADIFFRSGVRVLGLSASPAETEERIDVVKANCHLDTIVTLKGKAPFVQYDLVWVKCSESMDRAETFGFLPIFELLRNELKAFGLHLSEVSTFMAAKEREQLKKQIEALPRTRGWYRLVSTFASYEKLLFAHRVYMTESYAAFLDYVEKLRSDETPAARRLLVFTEFRRLIKTAEVERGNHPKIERLIRMLRAYKNGHRIAIVFFGNKSTAMYARERLHDEGVTAATVFGGPQKSVRKIHETIQRLRERKTRVLLATSVVEEGLSLPEVHMIVNYSLPQTAVARLQRAGRTGRMRPGLVVSLVLDHQLDRLTYFTVHRRLKHMESIQSENTEKGGAHQKTSFGRKKEKNEQTLPLFAGHQ